MASQNDTGFLTITAGAARAANLRVYNSSGTWTTADATHGAIGVQQVPSLATTDKVAIKCCNASGTVKMTASEAITAGANVYAAAAGKVASTGTIIEGQALEAATLDGDVIEVVPLNNRDVSTASTGTTAATFQVDSDVGKPRAGLKSQTGGTGDYVAYLQAPATLTGNRTYTGPADADDTLVGAAATQTLTNKTLTAPLQVAPNAAKTTGFSVTAALSGTTFTTKGASGTVTFALPPATVGLKYRFYVGAVQELRIDPDGTETISLPSTGVAGAAGKYITANAIGETVEIECCEAGTWAVFGYTGTWTSE